MNKKIVTALLCGALCSPVFADNMADDVFGDDSSNLSQQQTSNDLTKPVNIQKTYYNINDVQTTLGLYNVKSNIAVLGNSGNGFKVTTQTNIKDFLDAITPKLGYSYKYVDGVVVFTALNPKPVVVTPIPAPVKITPVIAPVQTPAPTPAPIEPTNKEIKSLLPATAQSTPVVTTPIKSNVTAAQLAKPIVIVDSTKNVIAPQSWVLSPEDRTIKNTFVKWGKQSGWAIVWDSNHDYPIKTGAIYNGTIESAINEVCRGSTITGTQMNASVSSRNKTIIITTSQF